MSTYSVNAIKQDVRVCLDENRVDSALLADDDVDTLSLDDIIESKILEAVDRVQSVAPYSMLHIGHSLLNDNDGMDNDNNGTIDDEQRQIHWKNGDTWGWIELPSDFMRLVVFEMSDWERPVYTAISTLDPKYAMQRSEVIGIRGTYERPVVAIGMYPNGKVLEFYSCKNSNATIAKALYIPYAIISNGTVDISDECYNAVLYTIAGLTLTSCGEVEKANSFFEKSTSYLTK